MTSKVLRMLACVLALLAAANGGGWSGAAYALSIELKDVAADRVDRQRSFQQGALPLPGTPNVAILDERLKEKSVSIRAPIFIRVYKTESELEVWKEQNGAFVLFATYPICHWSGSLGPKLKDGDKQAPEGFYTVARKQLRHVGRWPRSLYLNYPNIFDQSQSRTGAHILIHGGCTSVGCFAMTNPVMEEIHRLAAAAIDGGQEHIPIHVLPFRMTKDNWEANDDSPWKDFWLNLKEGHDLFEKTKLPPKVGVCNGKYTFAATQSATESGQLEDCGTTIATMREQDEWLDNVPPPTPVGVGVHTAAAVTERTPNASQRASLTDSVIDAGIASLPSELEDTKHTGEPEKFRCRYALKVCRRSMPLANLLAAKRAALLSSGMRRIGLNGE